jgi:hypothetical protein
MPTDPVYALVKSLMEAEHLGAEGVLPDGFADLDPVLLVKAMARYRRKALGTPRYRHKMKIACWGGSEILQTVMDMLAQAQPKVTGEVMSDAIEALEVSLDYGVWGGEVFEPRILPNGALLIRNHHRVIGIDEVPTLQLRLDHAGLRAELERILAGADAASDDATPYFFAIHRHDSGEVSISKALPEALSAWGQTLLFMGTELDFDASEALAEVRTVAEGSRSGYAVLRVFADHTWVHSTSRFSDDLDTVLEEHADVYLSEWDEPYPLDVGIDHGHVKQRVASRVRELCANDGIERPSGVMGYYFDYLFSDPDHYQSYASRKAAEIHSLTPWFASQPDRPVHYYTDNDPFWSLSEHFEHRLAAVRVPMQLFASIDDFGKRFVKALTQRYFTPDRFPPHRLKLLLEDPRWASEEDLLDLDAPAAKKWVKAQAKAMKTQLAEALAHDPEADAEEAEHDILYYGSTEVCVVMLFEERPDHVALNAQFKALSGEVDGGGQLNVPGVGFCQGYDCGGYDTGNAPTLLTPAQYSGAEDEDFEEEFDADEDDES